MLQGNLSKLTNISLSNIFLDLKTGSIKYTVDLLNKQEVIIGTCTEKEIAIDIDKEIVEEFISKIEEEVAKNMFEDFDKVEEEFEEVPQIEFKMYGNL